MVNYGSPKRKLETHLVSVGVIGRFRSLLVGVCIGHHRGALRSDAIAACAISISKVIGIRSLRGAFTVNVNLVRHRGTIKKKGVPTVLSKVATGGVHCVDGARLALNSVFKAKAGAQRLNNYFNTRAPDALVLAIEAATFLPALLRVCP